MKNLSVRAWRRAAGAAAFAALAALCAAACATKPAAAPPAAAKIGNVNWPDFVLNPPDAEDVIYGTGAAKMATPQASMQFAENRARVSIAQKISTLVKNRIVDLQQGSEGDPALQQFQQSISESLTKATLSGTKVVKREPMPDGTMWVLMTLPKDEAKRAATAALGQNPNKRLSDIALKEMNAAFQAMDKETIPVEN